MANHPALLFQGYRGDAVKECKERMKKLGFYSGPIDTLYNYEIAGAAVKLQQQEKLKPVNGGFYEECWDALDRLEAKELKKGDDPSAPSKEQEPAKDPAAAKDAQPAKDPAPAKSDPPAPAADKKEPPTPSAAGLKQGATGTDVIQLQQKLIKCGYGQGGIDGQYGPGTAFAVKAFQAAHGLDVTGIADGATLDALDSAAKSVSPPSTPAKVQPPGTSVFNKPGWNQKVFVHGDKAELFASARGLDGRDIIFIVEIHHGDGKWVHLKDVPGKVQDGMAAAELQVDSDTGTARFMRFKIQLATQQKR